MERRINSNAEMGIVEAQKRSMTLGDEARGYEGDAKNILQSEAARPILEVVKKYFSDITSKTGPEQSAYLDKLVRDLNNGYASFMGDTWKDEDERAPLALALVRYVKSLQ